MRLDDVRGFVLDVDGTLVHRAGEEVHVLPGAREALARIRGSGRPLALFTNGSHIPPAGFADGASRGRASTSPTTKRPTPLKKRAGLPPRSRSGGHDAASSAPTRRASTSRQTGSTSSTVTTASARTPCSSRTRTSSDFPELERGARAILAGARLLTGSFVARLCRRERADLQPRRDAHRGAREGDGGPARRRRQALPRRAAGDRGAVRRTYRRRSP